MGDGLVMKELPGWKPVSAYYNLLLGSALNLSEATRDIHDRNCAPVAEYFARNLSHPLIESIAFAADAHSHLEYMWARPDLHQRLVLSLPRGVSDMRSTPYNVVKKSVGNSLAAFREYAESKSGILHAFPTDLDLDAVPLEVKTLLGGFRESTFMREQFADPAVYGAPLRDAVVQALTIRDRFLIGASSSLLELTIGAPASADTGTK